MMRRKKSQLLGNWSWPVDRSAITWLCCELLLYGPTPDIEVNLLVLITAGRQKSSWPLLTISPNRRASEIMPWILYVFCHDGNNLPAAEATYNAAVQVGLYRQPGRAEWKRRKLGCYQGVDRIRSVSSGGARQLVLGETGHSSWSVCPTSRYVCIVGRESRWLRRITKESFVPSAVRLARLSRNVQVSNDYCLVISSRSLPSIDFLNFWSLLHHRQIWRRNIIGTLLHFGQSYHAGHIWRALSAPWKFGSWMPQHGRGPLWWW